MDSPCPRKVAVIGADPAGLVLAISLLQRGIKCDIYKSRPIQHDSSVKYAALSLQVNGLRVLYRIGLYSRLLLYGYSAETMYINEVPTAFIPACAGTSLSRSQHTRVLSARAQSSRARVYALPPTTPTCSQYP